MSEKPILFSGPMVRAILDGAKTQTRRLVKRQVGEVIDGVAWYPDYYEVNGDPGSEHQIPSPVSVGDTLWVKETWRTISALDHLSPATIGERALEAGYPKPWAPLMYDADGSTNGEWALSRGAPGKTRVSIHMPRWASRLTLRVIDIRVERLGGISEADCIAEGAVHAFEAQRREFREAGVRGSDATWHPLRCFPWLWCQVHGPDAWERDRKRWVWVYGFEVVR